MKTNNFHLNTKGLWKRCRKPKRKPDYVSFKRRFVVAENCTPMEALVENNIPIACYKHHFTDDRGDVRVYYECKKSGISSRYWYGSDSKGDYVIRESDHWGKVAGCTWFITKESKDNTGRFDYGKIYLNNLTA